MSSSVPSDSKLYNTIILRVYKKNMPVNSKYRSGILVMTYKKEFAKRYGPNINPYKKQPTGLIR